VDGASFRTEKAPIVARKFVSCLRLYASPEYVARPRVSETAGEVSRAHDLIRGIDGTVPPFARWFVAAAQVRIVFRSNSLLAQLEGRARLGHHGSILRRRRRHQEGSHASPMRRFPRTTYGSLRRDKRERTRARV